MNPRKPDMTPGEAVMKEPTVLAKMEYKDGKIIVKDKVQIQPEAESKPKPESATQTNARQENPGLYEIHGGNESQIRRRYVVEHD